MPPKKPVKNLIKKSTTSTEEDRDTTITPLSESVMESLEEMVGGSEDLEVIFEDDVEVLQPASMDLFEETQTQPQPSTSKTQPQPSTSKTQPQQSTSKTVTSLHITHPSKARSKNLIWAFFVIDDIKVPNKSGVGTCIEKGAKCQVALDADGKIICNSRMRQGGSTTSGLNSHLKSQHPKAWAAFVAAKNAEHKEKLGTKRAIEDMFDEIEGTPPSKKYRLEPMSGMKTLPKSPYTRDLKYERRGRIQLQWELWMTEYWIRMGFSWSKLDDPAHKEFWNKVNPKYHIKCSTTYSRAKLPLLFDQVKAAVDKKIQKDVQFTSGVGITADHWTSRNDDPYIGLTLHIISKDWNLDR